MDATRATRVTEDRLIVTSGSRTCPHPSLAGPQRNRDLGIEETREAYIARHCRDHHLGDFDNVEDAERNLGVWCLYFCARYIIGNPSLGVGADIVAHWEPCWEDAEYLANWVFAPSDTEQDVPWNERSFKLLPYAERDHERAVFKRFKKLTKVRRTQKTSWGKALITFEQLHAYYVRGNANYRVLIISATSTLARDHYLTPLAEMWESHDTLQRLYGATWVTARGKQLIALAKKKSKRVGLFDDDVEPDEDMLEAETRKLALLAKGSRPKDTLRMRWVIKQKGSSGKSSISLKVAGMTTTTAGNRWDLIIVDDPVVEENITTDKQRRKVDKKIADLRKQGDANARIVYLNTPWHIDDASQRIDRDQGDQWHIMYRPAMWFETNTGRPVYYWEYNALDPGDPVPGEPPANAVWTPELIEAERGQPDFYSQILLQPKNPETALYVESDFEIVDPAKMPTEITAGLGDRAITEQERAWLDAEGVEIRAYQFVDTAGSDKPTEANDESFSVCYRITSYGDLIITRLAAGRWTPVQEMDAVYEGWTYNKSSVVEYEVSGGHVKFVTKAFREFQARKSTDIKRPVTMPIHFRNARSTKSKYVRVPQMHPFIKAGRVKVLSNAAPPALIKRFILQWTDWGSDPRDDGADAASRIIYYVDVSEQFEERPADEPEANVQITDDGNLHFPAELIIQALAAQREDGERPWGQRG